MDQLPLHADGTVDKKALAELHSGGGYKESAPRNELDLTLMDSWKKVLKLTSVAIGDNFFDLGGNSLQATQLISHMRGKTEARIELEDLFNYATLSELSDLLQARLEQHQTTSHLTISHRMYG
ncbi:non-ribosomal peptide synthetase, partial [Pseudomonas syringae pv. pisi]